MALPVRGDDGDPVGPDGDGPGALARGQVQVRPEAPAVAAASRGG